MNVLEPPPPTEPLAGNGAAAVLPGHGAGTARTDALPAVVVRDLDALARRVRQLRVSLGQPTVRWAAPCLRAALERAVGDRGWPTEHAEAALLAVAADPASKGPMRLAEAGPWWDAAERSGDPVERRSAAEQRELAALESRLDSLDGARVGLQARARRQLSAEGRPMTRATVARLAVELLDADIRAASQPASRPGPQPTAA